MSHSSFPTDFLAPAYNSRSNLVKYSLYALGSVSSAFFLGFGFYYLFNHKTQQDESAHIKHIPIDILRKMVKKIKHNIVYNLVIMLDKLKDHDKNEDFSSYVIDDELQPFVNLSNSLLSQEHQHPNTNTSTNPPHPTPPPKMIEDEAKRRYREIYGNPHEVKKILIDYEISIIHSFNYNPQEYLHSLQLNINDEQIRNDLDFLEKVKNNYDKGLDTIIDYPETICKNYLKIISNIYYLNLKKVQRKVKYDFIDRGFKFERMNEAAKVLNELYRVFLKETRNQVMDYFKVTDSDVLSSKYLLRTYILQHSIHHPLRKVYIQMNDDINIIIDSFKIGTVYEEFLDDNHRNAMNGPADKLIDFGRFLGRADISKHALPADDIVINEVPIEHPVKEGNHEEDDNDTTHHERIFKRMRSEYTPQDQVD